MELAERLRRELKFEYIHQYPVLRSHCEVLVQPCPGIFHPDIETMVPLGAWRRNLLADAHFKTKFCYKHMCGLYSQLYMYRGLLYSKEMVSSVC